MLEPLQSGGQILVKDLEPCTITIHAAGMKTVYLTVAPARFLVLVTITEMQEWYVEHKVSKNIVCKRYNYNVWMSFLFYQQGVNASQ